MFGFLFLNTVSKLKKRKVLKSKTRFCFAMSPKKLSLVTLFIVTIYTLSINHGVALSFAKKIPTLSVSNESFLLTTGSEIIQYTPSNFTRIMLVTELSDATYLEVASGLEGKTFIFWCNSKENVIYRTSLKSSGIVHNSSLVIAKGMSSIVGLFADQFGHNLYWLDRKSGRLEVTKFDGSMRTSLLYPINNPQYLAGDSHLGWLFWTSVNNKGKQILERSRFDASERHVTYESVSTEETIDCLAVDALKRKLYWVDKRSNTLHKSNYEGRMREIVGHSPKLLSVISIIVVNDYLFWIEDDISSGSLVQVNLKNLDERKILTLNRPFMYYAKLFPRLLSKPSFLDNCLENNGGCSHLCLRSGSGSHSCLCPYSLELASDRKTCHAHGPILGFASKESDHHTMHFVDWDDPHKWVFPPIKIPVENVVGFTADPEKDEIYWIDGKKILKQSLAGQTELVLNLSYFQPKSLALDWKSENLYTLSADNKNSSVLSFCTSSGHLFSHIIWENMFKPLQLAVDPDNMKLFWSHRQTNCENPYCFLLIETSDFNGKSRKVFVNTTENVQSFVTDSRGKQLCWLNQAQNHIACQNYEGNEVQILELRGKSKFTVMCSFDGFLMVANEIGILQSINVSADQQNALFLNSTLSICFITVLAQSRYSANYPRYQNSRFLLNDNFRSNRKDDVPLLLYMTGVYARTISLTDSRHPEFLPYSIFDHMSMTNGTIDKVAYSNYGGVKTLYWIESENKISSIHLDGKGKKYLIEMGSHIGGIAVDPIIGNIYWTLPYEQKILMANHAGLYPVVLLNLALSHSNQCAPKTITFDEHSRLVYFVLCCVEMCSINIVTVFGDSFTTLLKSHYIIGDLVTEQNYLYWTEINLGAIKRLNLQSQEIEIIVESDKQNTFRPFSLFITDSVVYWTDSSINNGALLVKRFHSSEMVVLRNASEPWKLLLLSNKDIGDSSSNLCLKNNGGCSQLCTFNEDVKCYCSFSQLVNKKCQPYSSYLLIADGDKIFSVDYQNPSTPNSPLPTINANSTLNNILTLAYDDLQDRIFFSVLYRSPYIYSIKPDGTDLKSELNVSKRMRHVEGMVFDSMLSTLFWTESSRPSIWSLQNGSEHQLIELGRNDKPRGIAIHSCSGQVFWTNENKIEAASLLGENRRAIITEGLVYASGLAILNNELYWTNRKEDVILEFYLEISDLDGSNRRTFASGQYRRPFALVPTETDIFWTDRENKVLCQSSPKSPKSCQVIRRHLENPFGLLIVRRQKVFCDGNLTKPLICDGSTCQNVSSSDFANTGIIDSVHGTVHNLGNISFQKLVISGSVISTGAVLVIILFMIRRQRRRKRFPKCSTIKNSISKSNMKDRESSDCMLRSAISNPSFELDDVFCADILEDDILMRK